MKPLRTFFAKESYDKQTELAAFDSYKVKLE